MGPRVPAVFRRRGGPLPLPRLVGRDDAGADAVEVPGHRFPGGPGGASGRASGRAHGDGERRLPGLLVEGQRARAAPRRAGRADAFGAEGGPRVPGRAVQRLPGRHTTSEGTSTRRVTPELRLLTL